LDLEKYLPNEKISRGIIFCHRGHCRRIYGIVCLFKHNIKYVDDFKIYYYTGKAFNDGLNPYDQANISKEAGFEQKTIYRYAPYTLYVSGH